jgi:transcription termination/antitermination protein NusG
MVMDDPNLANPEPSAVLPPQGGVDGGSLSVPQSAGAERPSESAVAPLLEQPQAAETREMPVADAAGEEEKPQETAGQFAAPGDERTPADVGSQEADTVVEKKPGKKAEEKTAEAEEGKEEEKKSDKMDWYILKVQSNREESIREGLLRRVAITGLGYYFDEVIVPTEKVTEFKGGKKKVIKRKLYPGYLVVHMEINDDTWFLVRETPGIGDFTGAAGRPSPMLPHEVARIVAKQEEKSEKAPKLKIAFREGERVKIKEGTFENFEGDVDSIDETNGRVTVMINIFGRSTPVELEYWQIETL